MRSYWIALMVPSGVLAVGSAVSFGGCGISLADNLAGAGGGVLTGVSSSSGTGGGLTITGTAGGSPAKIGAACMTDAKCGGDLHCLGPDGNDPVFGGGAPDGFCTKPCASDADCGQENAVCYGLDANQPGRCTLSCTIGPPLGGTQGLFSPLATDKCLGRSEARCAKASDGSGVCLPTCGSDAQCGDNRCDPRTAMCVAAPSTGLPFGVTCDPSQMPSACAGVCVGFQTNVSMCSEPCVLGGASMDSVDCGGAAHGLCAWHPPQNGVGDTGYCTPACASQADCQTPSFWCFGVPELTQALHVGYCFAATPCPHGPSDCSPTDGGTADAGAADAGYACTMTAGGPFCLDSTFPIGDGGAEASPPDAGAYEDAGDAG